MCENVQHRNNGIKGNHHVPNRMIFYKVYKLLFKLLLGPFYYTRFDKQTFCLIREF